MNQYAARLMIRRRAGRAVTTGIIACLANVGALEHRQCPRTTKPYDRMCERLTAERSRVD